LGSRARWLCVGLLLALVLALPQAASADLAAGKPATASSVQNSEPMYQPQFANDGNSTTRWSSNFFDNQWWQVDLGTAQQVNQVTINWEIAYATRYQVQVSTDGTNFTTVADVTNTAPGLKTSNFNAISARYVRILGITRATQYGFSIWDVQVNGPATATTGLPDRFRDNPIWTGLDHPIAVRFAPFPDSRVFVAEKSGLIKEYDSVQDTTATQVADLSRVVHNFWDRGILGLAVDPGWPSRPYIYVSYTYDAPVGGTAPRWGGTSLSDPCPNPPGATGDGCVVSGRLSKLTIDPLSNQMTSEQVLINDWCQQFPSHSVGDVRFGADGALYMSGGEGASFNYADYGQTGNPCNDPPGGTMTLPTANGGSLRSQSIRRPAGQPTVLSGTVIRVDPDTGLGKTDNPLGTSAGTNAHRIVAAGLRNPFRFTIRPGTNELWIGDVGQNTWDEINRDASPTSGVQNFGWPCFEGNATFGLSGANACSGLTNNQGYFAYHHSLRLTNDDPCPTANGTAISGLTFYSGGNYPAAYKDALFFADHSRSCIWVAKAGTNGLPDMNTVTPFYTAQTILPVDLQTGPGGDLFYVNHEGGSVNRITYTGANQQPTARISSNVTSGDAPLPVQFDGTGSSDPDAGQTLTYSWDLDGNGTFGDSTAAKPTFTYTNPGVYTVSLRVSDNQGGTDTTTLKIAVSQHPPTAVIDSPAATLSWKVGDTINFSGHATDPEQGNLAASALTWHLIIHHCTTPTSCHEHAIQDFSGASGSFSAPDHSYPSWLELQLVAKDATGLTDTKSVRLDPQTKTLSFDTVPSGGALTVNGDTSTTPFNRTVIVGSNNSVTAPASQTLGGSAYDFSSWSDGGAANHNVIAGATDSYTATYVKNTASVDLAKGKPATASSVQNSEPAYQPQFANDGSTSTRWSSNFTDDQWWRVDLGSTQQIGKLSVNWENAYATRYQVQVSTDGTSFTTVADVTNNAAGVKTTTFTPVSARYVRILGITRATQYGYSIWEVQVFGTDSGQPPPLTELAKGRPASASSVQNSEPSLAPGFGNDGSTSTRWSSNFLDNQWWQVDLGAAQQVSQVTINWENAYATRYQVQTSTDGTSFTTVADVTNNAAGPKTTSFATVSARYVRILGITRATQYGFSFWEVQVMGTAVSSPPAPPPTQVELARSQPATASSIQNSTYPANLANDGSTTTRWSSVFADNQWWRVDLGSTKQVNQVTVNWEAAYASRYQVQVSTDGTNFTTVADVTSTAAGVKTSSFPAVAARYVRVLGLTRGTVYGFSIWEAQVFGPG
jgi:glucose/arabinose dehydrogenase